MEQSLKYKYDDYEEDFHQESNDKNALNVALLDRQAQTTPPHR
jgi:hypothetical protein